MRKWRSRIGCIVFHILLPEGPQNRKLAMIAQPKFGCFPAIENRLSIQNQTALPGGIRKSAWGGPLFSQILQSFKGAISVQDRCVMT